MSGTSVVGVNIAAVISNVRKIVILDFLKV